MAQENTGVQNKGMLLIALAVAAMVVVIYNWQISHIREESKGKTIRVLTFNRDMKSGEDLRGPEHLTVQEVSKQFEGPLGDVYILEPGTDLKSIVGKLGMNAQKDEYFRLSQLEAYAGERVSRIPAGMVEVTVPIDSQEAPGDMLRVGDHVNIVGKLSLNNGPLRSYRILDGIEVLGIGGRGIRDTAGRGPSVDEGMTSYRSIQVALPPDVSLQLSNILTHVAGGVRLELLPPTKGRIEKPSIKPPLDAVDAVAKRPAGAQPGEREPQ